MKCLKCQSENRESVKFCEECGAKLEILCPSCGAAIPLGKKFCGECGHELKKPSKTKPIDYSEPKSYTPKFLAEKILTNRSAIEGERKILTVLFADVANYTAMSEKLDPEEVHQIMDGCFKILMDEIHKYEGTINQFTGDGVMALFGAPVALEDHAQAACYSALSIQNSIRDYEKEVKKNWGADFKMRIGLNSGPVIVGAIGDDLRMDYTAVGDTTNLASRMEGMAQPDSILVTNNICKQVKDFFEFRPLGKVQVKGKEEPQEAFELIKAGSIETRIEASVAKGLTKYVGRKNSTATLKEAYEIASKGRGQVVGIVGEAGVGKSRLLFEFVKSLKAGDFRYLEGRCIHYGETLPYFPFIDILKKFCHIEDTDGVVTYRKKLKETVLGLDPAFESSLPFLEDLLSLEIEDKAYAKMEPDQRRWKTIDAVKNLFVRQSQLKPLILAVDDLHWIDKSSEELLTRLIEGIANSKILLLCLYRPEYRHRWTGLSYYQRLGLTQLTPQSSTKLVEAILKEGRVDKNLSDLVLGKAGGNPLFIEEYTRSLLDTNSISSASGKYVLSKKASEIDVPDNLQAVIASRIDRMEQTLKHVLQVASVIGRDFAFRVLKMVLKMKEELREHLANLQGLEFIYEKTLFPELEYIFKHAITQEVAYNNLLLQRRKDFHKLAGQAIEELYVETIQEHLGPLAFHFYRAEAWEKAFKYLVAAGERARFNYATRESINYLDRAIEVSQKIPDLVNKEQLMRLYENRGRTLQILAEFEKAENDFQKNKELAQELGNKKKEAHSLISIAQCQKGGGGLLDINKMEKYLDEALDIIKETGDVAGEVRYHIIAGMFMGGDVGIIDKAREHLQRAIDICNKFGDKRGIGPALGFLGLSHYWTGDIEESLREVKESADIGRELKNQFLLISTYHWLMLAYTGKGQYDEALNALELLKNGAQEIGSKHLIAMIPNHYGWIYSELCNFEKAIFHNKNGVELSQLLEDPECEIFSLLNLAGDYYNIGDYDKAQECLSEVAAKRELKWYKVREWRYGMHFSKNMSLVSLAKGDYSKALEFAEDTLSRGNNTASKKYIATGLMLKGRTHMSMDNFDEAASSFEKAMGLADQMFYPPLMWKIRFLLSQTHIKQGNNKAARELLEKSAAIIEKMSLKVSDAETKETFLTSEPVQAVYKELKTL